jgi:hypothetical protein
MDRVLDFRSILFPSFLAVQAHEANDQAEMLADLNLDQIFAAVMAGKAEYNLTPFFHAPQRDMAVILYRHEVMHDLENAALSDCIRRFAEGMREMRRRLERHEKLRFTPQKQRWFLDAVDVYCDAVTGLTDDLSAGAFSSRGLRAFRDYLVGYVASPSFGTLRELSRRLLDELSAIHYCMLINGPRVQVRKFGGESDYSAEVEETFARFRQGSVKEYTFNPPHSESMNHIEENVFNLVAKLYPPLFAELESFCAANLDYLDLMVATFDREIQFYVSYLEYIRRLKAVGLAFCYPRLVQGSKEVRAERSFDLALAGRLLGEDAVPVCNEFRLAGPERIIVVSGPNQGGKTTFARTFGQLHYLASLGFPVPGTDAQLFLFDNLFTHFERGENMNNLWGKLQDDLVRIRRILDRATPNSVVVMNEIFTSTTLTDAVALSKRIAARLIELDLLCVWVTFIDELASLGEQTVSMVSTVVPENPAVRTYKILRRPADGLSYALSIAEKHRLTYPLLKERVSL